MIRATQPQAMPPFPRMALNREINKTGFIPSRVDLVISTSDLMPRGRVAHSNHRITGQLDATDLARIATAKQNWRAFRDVELVKYREIAEIASQAAEANAVKR